MHIEGESNKNSESSGTESIPRDGGEMPSHSEHVPSHAQPGEEQMVEPMSTPVVSTSYPTDDGLHRPPRPANRRTRSMVRKGMPTQSTEREGTTNTTAQHNEDEVPSSNF